LANSFYTLGIEAFLEGSIAALTDTLKCSLVTTGYTPNLATDQFYNIIAGGNITAAGVALASKSGAGGTLSAANVTFTSVSGAQSAYLVLYKDTGTSSTSPLIGLIDTATGLPVTPNGGNITVAWSSGQVFTLFEGLPASERGRLKQLRDWFREVARMPARLGPEGLWLPEPRLVQV
jgi:hypothetical protein